MRRRGDPRPFRRALPSRRIPLDQIRRKQVAQVVDRIVATRRDEARIAAAKFSSAI